MKDVLGYLALWVGGGIVFLVYLMWVEGREGRLLPGWWKHTLVMVMSVVVVLGWPFFWLLRANERRVR